MSQHLLPEAIAAYRAGQTLNFGALNVTPQGLSLEEARKDLPWEQLGEVYEAGGYLVIQKKGTLTAWRVEVSTTLNLCVFLRLVRQIKADNRVRGNEQRSLSYQPLASDLLQPSEWQEYE